MIPTRKRLEYVAGYLDLKLLNEAADELERIAFTDRLSPEVLLARLELALRAKQWDMVVDLGRAVAKQTPASERPWILTAYALRELNRIEEARDIMLLAEPFHGETSSALHYNLACYYSLLGCQDEAKARLRRACEMDEIWKGAAVDESDLKPLWGAIKSLD